MYSVHQHLPPTRPLWSPTVHVASYLTTLVSCDGHSQTKSQKESFLPLSCFQSGIWTSWCKPNHGICLLLKDTYSYFEYMSVCLHSCRLCVTPGTLWDPEPEVQVWTLSSVKAGSACSQLLSHLPHPTLSLLSFLHKGFDNSKCVLFILTDGDYSLTRCFYTGPPLSGKWPSTEPHASSPHKGQGRKTSCILTSKCETKLQKSRLLITAYHYPVGPAGTSHKPRNSRPAYAAQTEPYLRKMIKYE